MVDKKGVPLAVSISAANVNDSKLLQEVVDSVGSVRGRRGRPRKRPEKLHAAKGYDYLRCRRFLRKRGIKTRIARRGVDSSEKLGRYRWVVERAFSWLYRFRSLSIVRYERRVDNLLGFAQLGYIVILLRHLRCSR